MPGVLLSQPCAGGLLCPCSSILHYARGTQMLLTNNFIVVKIDRVYHCNLAFSKGESLGGLQQIIQLSQLLRKSNACLMRQLLCGVHEIFHWRKWAPLLRENIKIWGSHSFFMLCTEYFWGEMNAWSLGLVSESQWRGRVGVRSKVPPSLLLPSLSWPGLSGLETGDWQVVTLLVHFSHTSTNTCPAFRSEYVLVE